MKKIFIFILFMFFFNICIAKTNKYLNPTYTEISNVINAPFSIISINVIEKKKKWRLLKVLIVTENVFGATIKTNFLLCIRLLKNDFYETPEKSTQCIENQELEKTFLDIYKKTIGWENLH